MGDRPLKRSEGLGRGAASTNGKALTEADLETFRIMRQNLTHFAESGRMFHDITELSAKGIPTISVVFGSSTAGGAYQPGLSDYNIFVRDAAAVFLGGPPLVKVATGEEATEEELSALLEHHLLQFLARRRL